MSQRDVLVIGYGSIGARHARLASALGHDVSVVSRRKRIAVLPQFATLEQALANRQISHVIVANETSAHWPTVAMLRTAGFQGRILVEKPVVARLPADPGVASLTAEGISVAYNLRFHPAVRLLKERLSKEPAINATLIAGQDLRTWRPGRSLDNSYSADRAFGGGVLRDLSHELDLFLWLFGSWSRLISIGGQLGPLPINADDCWSVLLSAERCHAASIQLDYYNRPGLRLIIVNTASGTMFVDLVRHIYRDENGEEAWPVDRDASYIAQLQSFLANADDGTLCTLAEGLQTVSMIEAVEEASSTEGWVYA